LTDKYEVKEELGRGAFSVVKLVVEKETGVKYAVKMINKSHVGQDMARLATNGNPETSKPPKYYLSQRDH